MQKQYRVGDKVYTLRHATSEDIEAHYVIAVDEESSITAIKDVYVGNMHKSVNQRLAFVVEESDGVQGFMYGYVEDYLYTGASIVSHNMIATVILFRNCFIVNPYSHKMIFVPHNRDSMLKFLSILTGASVRRYYNGKPYVTVLRDEIVPKGYKVFMYLGIEEI